MDDGQGCRTKYYHNKNRIFAHFDVLKSEYGRGTFKAKQQTLALGRHKVAWDYDPCIEKGLMDKESKILLTRCNADQFTCE